MKRKYLYLLAAVIMMASCKKNVYNITDRNGVEGKSLVKVGLFNMTTLSTNVLIYNNGERISNAIASPYPFPGSGLNTPGPTAYGDYFALAPGENKLQLFTTNPGTANLISKIFETTQTLDADRRYTIYITDTAANTVAIKAPDDATAPDSGFARIRFINLIPNSDAVDFYKGNVLLRANVAYKAFTPFFDIPASTADSFSIRPAGALPGSALSSTAYYRLAMNTNQRIMSFVCRGYISAADDMRKPKVTGIINQ